ncbi:M23 family metallopeptidase [Mechercharimyces sp. CAU 1602]|uniref:M23 family metallopeptidase n=1 Tax=Mechercharimyces sp. CAU 1602 TaxID=2973933 RepID=UPI002162A128|nr:M23 family metallopeptidase [Mechercharimyces sp. CAU 1602]MCS1352262.1 M23 family metallopeptidase [Mechercharimyces sp. CAU 1602]
MKPQDPDKRVKKLPTRAKWKRVLGKKWVFPAIYLGTAALIFTMMWWYQSSQNQSLPELGLETIQMNNDEGEKKEQKEESMRLPVADDTQEMMKMGYYEEADTDEAKEASLVKYANTFWPHSGQDYARKDGKEFEVVAALSGKVTRAEENPILGMVVEIEHENGLVTVYQSLTDVQVKAGDSVKSGEKIATSGFNKFEKEAGNHLHFEVRKEEKPLNPNQFISSKK